VTKNTKATREAAATLRDAMGSWATAAAQASNAARALRSAARVKQHAERRLRLAMQDAVALGVRTMRLGVER
jgi:hypothetical protein